MSRSGLAVVVIGGGQNCEHEVSLASAASVADALRATGHTVTELTIGRDGGWRAADRGIAFTAVVGQIEAADVVYPVLHGSRGEDGTVTALCDLAGVPCVGSSVAPSAIGMDKWASKLVAEAVGVATAPATLVTDAAAGADHLWEGPVVVKPVAAGSSHGVSLVSDPTELADAIKRALEVDSRALVESYVDGREIDIAIADWGEGPVVTAPLEILCQGIFDLETKYDGSARFALPAPLSEAEREQLVQAALAIFRALGCSGLARVDFFLTADGWVFNEINTIPGMTAQSQAPRMFSALGMPYVELVDRLVRGALERAS